LETLHVGSRVIPIHAPDRLDIVSLLEAFVAHQKRPAALNRLKLAAIGLGWYAAWDAMPAKSPSERADKAGSQPPFPRLEDCECDLLTLGKRVGAALGDDAVDARGHGDVLAAGWFGLVLPPEVQRERARKNSEGRPDHTGAPSSDSGASTTAIHSPHSV
jgi:hypothetical protein